MVVDVMLVNVALLQPLQKHGRTTTSSLGFLISSQKDHLDAITLRNFTRVVEFISSTIFFCDDRWTTRALREQLH